MMTEHEQIKRTFELAKALGKLKDGQIKVELGESELNNLDLIRARQFAEEEAPYSDFGIVRGTENPKMLYGTRVKAEKPRIYVVIDDRPGGPRDW